MRIRWKARIYLFFLVALFFSGCATPPPYKPVVTPVKPPTTNSENTTKPNVKKHTVQEGDSLYTLAVKYYDDGAKWKTIRDANTATLGERNDIKIGQTLLIPDH